MSYTSPTASAIVIGIVGSATPSRATVNILKTNIYVAGAQIEQVPFPTSYIPTTITGMARAGDFASVAGADFSS